MISLCLNQLFPLKNRQASGPVSPWVLASSAEKSRLLGVSQDLDF